MKAVHPGEILKEELDELGVTPNRVCAQIDVLPNRISQIITGKHAVAGDTALRFGHWFGTEPQFWLNLQGAYEIRIAEEKAGGEIVRCPWDRRSRLIFNINPGTRTPRQPCGPHP